MRQNTDTLTRPVSSADEAKVSRRALLTVGATAAGGLALAVVNKRPRVTPSPLGVSIA